MIFGFIIRTGISLIIINGPSVLNAEAVLSAI